MNLKKKQIALIDHLYRDARKGLLTAPALNTYLKKQGQTGFTIKYIKEYLDSLEQHIQVNHTIRMCHVFNSIN